jgi:amino acid permease
MKKKFSTKKTIIIVAIIIAVVILIGLSYQSFKNIIPEDPDTITLSEGRQIHFESLYVGLSSVSNNSAWLSIHKSDEEGSTSKQVVAGDTINIYGYKIEIKSVNKEYNFSIMPGSSHGNVKFIIKKQ